MKLLCTSDLHGDFTSLERLSRAAAAFDGVLIAGDITNFCSAKVASQMADEVLRSNKMVMVVPGNCDLPESSSAYDALEINLHGRGRIIGDIGFFGLGGSNITPFDTPLEFEDDEIIKLLLQGYGQVKNARLKVLLSHPPPHGIVDVIPTGDSVGSMAVRGFLEEVDVDLVICGHVHESDGSGYLRDTLVINTGPACRGFVEVELDPGGDILHNRL